MNKLIIFHADDFNLTTGVMLGVLETFKKGVVRSTSIMANLPNFEECVELLKENPNLDVGVHINLTYRKPVCDPSEVPSLVDDSGIFWRKPSHLIEVATVEDMKKEIYRQMEIVMAVGLKPTHLDTHHHLHQTDPRVLKILIELAKKYKMAIRSTEQKMRDILIKEGIPTPDNFSADFYGAENVTVENLEHIIETTPDGFSEIMCHPGFVDEDLFEVSTYNRTREAELKILTHVRTWQAVQNRGAKIISYKDLLEFFPGYERKVGYAGNAYKIDPRNHRKEKGK